jgi:hypothetical protein
MRLIIGGVGVGPMAQFGKNSIVLYNDMLTDDGLLSYHFDQFFISLLAAQLTSIN